MTQPIAYVNGEFVDLNSAKVSILDRGFNYGDGLFETMRAYGGQIFRLDLHLDRIYNSVDRIFLNLSISREEMRSIIYDTLKHNEIEDAIIRLTVTRGVSDPGLIIDPQTIPTIVVYVRPFKPLPPENYEDGVNISLFPASASRTSGIRVKVKSCNFLSNIIIKKLAGDVNSMEGIILDNIGRVCEGTTSNIFLIKQGQLLTPPINEFVLPGVTRKIVLEIAEKEKIPFKEKMLPQEELYKMDEIFLTNTGIEILPVVKADNQIIGTGKPGPLTRKIQNLFPKYIEDSHQ